MRPGTVSLIVGDRYGLADILRGKLEEQGGTVVISAEPDDLLNAGRWASEFDDVVQHLHRIDYVIGLVDYFQGSSFLQVNEFVWDRMIFHNVKTPLMIAQKTLPTMMKQGFGSIVFLSSPVSRTGMAQAAIYAASKGGLLGFTRSLALEVAKSNIRVNLVSVSETNDKLNTEQIAEVFFFLLNDESSFMTGQEVKASG